MNFVAADVERLVREVLAEIVAAQSAKPARCERPAPAAAPAPALPLATGEIKPVAPEKSAPVNGDLVVKSRVVTMAEVLGRLDGSRRLIVGRDAIVTPAVRDELLRRGISLQIADQLKNQSTTVRLALLTTGKSFDPAQLIAALQREGFVVEAMSSDCLMAATEQLRQEVAKPDTLGVLLSRHAAAGLCLANRLQGVRAITAWDAPSTAAAAASVGANLLVVSPQAGSFFQLKQMITEFGRGGVRPCPPVFREKLS